MRTFEFDDGNSRRFWNIELSGQSYTVTSGKAGTKGRRQTTSCADAALAQDAYDELIRQKVNCGFVETTTVVSSHPGAQALERGLESTPDDAGAFGVYADLLMEQGDRRGEFIQVQLALEEESRSAAERRKLKRREQDLLQKHRRQWLGNLYPFFHPSPRASLIQEWSAKYPEAPLSLIREEAAKLPIDDGHDSMGTYTFARGWLDTLEIGTLNVALARALCRAPQIRLLRRLSIRSLTDPMDDDSAKGPELPDDGGVVNLDADFAMSLFPLRGCEHFGNVRFLELGGSRFWGGSWIVDVIQRMPRIEELRLSVQLLDEAALFGLKTLRNLRLLQLEANNSYPFDVLARNASLGQLTHLICRPHSIYNDSVEGGIDEDSRAYIGLADVQALVCSPHLKRLQHLHLSQSDMGDPGCRAIVDSGILRRLNVLDLHTGCITDDGALVLAACRDLHRLERLDVSNNRLTGKGIDALRKTGIKVDAGNQRAADDASLEYLFEGDIE